MRIRRRAIPVEKGAVTTGAGGSRNAAHLQGSFLDDTNLQRKNIVEDVDPRAAVMLLVPDDIATKLVLSVDGAIPADDMHLTVGLFGAIADLPDDAANIITMNVRDLAAEWDPIPAVAGGFGRFPASKSSDGKDVVYVPVDAPRLLDFRAALLNRLELHGIRPRTDHGFTAHITLAYVETGAPVAVPTIPATEVSFSEILVKVGQEIRKFRLHRRVMNLGPQTDPADLTEEELLESHRRLHHEHRDLARGLVGSPVWSPGSLMNMHARVVDALYEAGLRHPPPPDDGLDEMSLDFEAHGSNQEVHQVAPVRMDDTAEDEVVKAMWTSPGGKGRLAKRLAAMLPKHKVYVEPFAGSAAVLFAKEACETEVINDADPEIVRAFSIIKKLTDDDLAKLEKMEWSGSRASYEKLLKAKPTAALEQLHRFLYVSRFSFGKMFGRGFDPTAEGQRATSPARIAKDVGRLKNVEIRGGDYAPVVKEFDSAESVFFFDPPYKDTQVHIGESAFDEDSFVKILKGLQGKFLLTYGTKGRLPKMLREAGFHIKKIMPARPAANFKGAKAHRVLPTLVVSNFEITQKAVGGLFPWSPSYGGEDPYGSTPPEDIESRFSIHRRWVGKSVVRELRLENPANGCVTGWDLGGADNIANEPIVTLAKAADVGAGLQGWPVTQKEVVCKQLGSEPRTWLDVAGIPRCVGPGSIGGNDVVPAVYHRIDKGRVEYGAQDVLFHEYFLNGDGLRGRVTVSAAVVKNEDGSVADDVTWIASAEDDPCPVVLSKAAVESGWMPEPGLSALPESVRKALPAEHRYWLSDNPKALRDLLVQKIEDGSISIDFAAVFASPPAQTETGIYTFKSVGQFGWRLELDVGETSLAVLKFAEDPRIAGVTDVRLVSVEKQADDIPVIERGHADLQFADESLLTLTLKGATFDGTYHAKRVGAGWSWAPATSVETYRAQVNLTVPIIKRDDEKRIVVGIVLEPDEIDAHKDTVDVEVIEAAAHDFLSDYNRHTRMGLMHTMFGDIGIELVESWIARENSEIGGQQVKKGSWLMAVRVVSDQLWAKIKAGELTGFSIGALATVSA